MIRAAIAGATGYTGGEVLRLLLHHPAVEVVAATTTSVDGVPVYKVHRDLLGETDLCFGTAVNDPDVLFLCLGHGRSRAFLDEHALRPSCRVIDLGNDFRTEPEYGTRHFVYGLTEGAHAAIAAAHDIANPGCFATAIQLALLPLVQERLLHDEVHVTALTGATGAGKATTDTTHFAWRSNNISTYKVFTHQHLAEIQHNLTQMMGSAPIINFVPLRGDYARGIFASVYTRGTAGMTQDDYHALYNAYYAASPFVHHSSDNVSLKEVVNTNKALLHVERHGDYVHITSVLDNLLKGAAGQAVQNMNLLFGRDEDEGLHLKAAAF